MAMFQHYLLSGWLRMLPYSGGWPIHSGSRRVSGVPHHIFPQLSRFKIISTFSPFLVPQICRVGPFVE